jgi:hypothetical protein
MKNLLKGIFLALIISGQAFAQSAKDQLLEVFVTDHKGKPLAEAFVRANEQSRVTDAAGRVAFIFSQPPVIIIEINHISYVPILDTIRPGSDANMRARYQLNQRVNVLIDVEITEETSRMEGITNIKAREVEFYSGPTSSVEGLIKTLPGVFSGSELSNQYNVRGGNFDENLVYVNGIEVYRPFLVRAGQQEGLSFINGDMVDAVNFSAGGFEARYGDKMASVLDIQYRKPTEFGVRTQASLMGGALTVEGVDKSGKLSAIGSARYRTNRLLVGSLDTEADFVPQFTDIQAYIAYDLSNRWEISFLGNYAQNIYDVRPTSRQTEFGTFSEALRLNIFFDGQERYQFTTRFGAASAAYKASDRLTHRFNLVGFQTVEEESFDVIGLYRLGELNNNLGSDDFGEIAFLRGTGGFQNYGRNTLDAIVYNLDYQGSYTAESSTWLWGVKIQGEDIVDRYKEFERIDSAGYSIPFTGPGIFDWINRDIQYAEGLDLFQHFDTRDGVQSFRYMTFVENNRNWKSNGHGYRLNLGVRTNYWTLNNQMLVSPRMAFSWKPDMKADWVFRLSGGWYQQPAFYREMRNISGDINTNLRAQQAIHAVLAADYGFVRQNRPFRFVTELYYKHMDNLVPYEIDNVRLRYSAVNNAVGYATGIDLRLHGEFLPGTESWTSFSLFTVRENIAGDGAGFIPRPTDNRWSFAIFFQDHLPKDPSTRLSLTLFAGGGFPHGAPQTERKDQVLRAPLYRRVDIGLIKVLKDENLDKKSWSALRPFKSFWISLEVFNLLQIRNTVSYLWVKDVSTSRQYGVPNYLTDRLINFKITAKI